MDRAEARGVHGRLAAHRHALPVRTPGLLIGIQVYKRYLLWCLMYMNITYFGLFGSPGSAVQVSMQAAFSGSAALTSITWGSK